MSTTDEQNNFDSPNLNEDNSCNENKQEMTIQTDNKPVYHWRDVTSEFIEAAGELELGELLHDASFGLFEAMSAIEMMDPKMDAGMMCNQIQRKVLNFEQAVSADTCKIKELSIPQLIGIIDASMACLVTWLEGHSLAQTVFTNLYLHDPYIIEDRCLKAFSIGMLKIIDHIRDRVNRASVFEEEDFQTMTYGFKMAADITDVRATGMMKEIEDEINRILKVRVQDDINRILEVRVKDDINRILEVRVKDDINRILEVRVKDDINRILEVRVKDDINRILEVRVKDDINRILEVIVKDDINRILEVRVKDDISIILEVRVKDEINRILEVRVKDEISRILKVRVKDDINRILEVRVQDDINRILEVRVQEEINRILEVRVRDDINRILEVRVKDDINKILKVRVKDDINRILEVRVKDDINRILEVRVKDNINRILEVRVKDDINRILEVRVKDDIKRILKVRVKDEISRILENTGGKTKDDINRILEVRVKDEINRILEVRVKDDIHRILEVRVKDDINRILKVRVKDEISRILEVRVKDEINRILEVRFKDDINRILEVRVKDDINRILEVRVKDDINRILEVKVKDDISRILEIRVKDDINRILEVRVEDDINRILKVRVKDEINRILEVRVKDDINRILETTRSKPGEDRQPDIEQEHELNMALYSRIKFNRLFLTLLLSLNKEKCEGVPQVKKWVTQMQEVLPVIKKTLSCGIQPETKEFSKNDYPTIMGFEPLVNQRLLPPTFPRYTVIKSREECISYMETLMNQLHILPEITQMVSLHAILETFKEFSIWISMIRALTFLPVNKRVFGTIPMVDYLKDTIRNFIAPPCLSQKSQLYNNAQAKTFVDAWFMQAVRPVCTLIQIPGHNRARQRDKWGHILEELSALQEEADKVDAYLHQLLSKTEPSRQHIACLGNWVLYLILQAMVSYLLAGFELELYATYEYHYVYWYLSEMLYSWMINTLHRADNFLLEHETVADSQQKGKSNKKNKKKKRTKTLNKEITQAQAEQQLFNGYYKAVLGFRQDGKLVQPNFEFDSEEVRYSHRFQPFTTVSTPPYIHYNQYREMSDIGRYDSDSSVSSLLFLFIQTLTKISKTNFVVMKLLMGGHKKDSKIAPDFDYSLHKAFPVLKIL
ncbi:NAA35 [Mytilus coruscus]|uniref:Protein MAK10 homolog n=1 Tax=Mytilus coruscus TaxID=42192 RepID=A0A6J8AYX0_MYTCO|nr:NAA35 [Mytilus coruscus]